jgi:hypothetical protein
VGAALDVHVGSAVGARSGTSGQISHRTDSGIWRLANLFRHLTIHRQETGVGRERDMPRVSGKVTIAFPFAKQSKGEQ